MMSCPHDSMRAWAHDGTIHDITAPAMALTGGWADSNNGPRRQQEGQTKKRLITLEATKRSPVSDKTRVASGLQRRQGQRRFYYVKN